MTPMKITSIKGFADILPGEVELWQAVEATARRVFNAYNFSEIRIPILEKTELFSRSIGETTDIVEKEMYTFDDRAGESVTLRPEATASLLRAYIEHGLHVQPKPVRLYTMGPMFRYERPQAGRYRQFHQINAEAIGEDHPAVDAEVIAMLLEFMRQLGLAERLTLQVNSLGDGVCRPAYRECLVSYLRAHAGALCEECRDRTERNPLRVLDCKNDACRRLNERAPRLIEFLSDSNRAHFERVDGFDARFFVILAPEGWEPVPDPAEVDDAFWMTASEALVQMSAGRLLMAPPTIEMLQRLEGHESVAEAIASVRDDRLSGPGSVISTRLSPLVHLVLAPNPGLMTGPGVPGANSTSASAARVSREAAKVPNPVQTADLRKVRRCILDDASCLLLLGLCKKRNVIWIEQTVIYHLIVRCCIVLDLDQMAWRAMPKTVPSVRFTFRFAIKTID